MRKKQTFITILLFFSITTIALFGQDVKKSASFFVKKCAACHTIGNPDSDLDGPDLADALAYSTEDLEEAFDSMEEEIEEKIDAETRAGLIAFFRSEDAAGILKDAVSESENSFGEGLDAGDIAKGKALYDGSLGFANGAVSCRSCHDQFGSDVLGGSLGPSLVGLYEKMGKTRLFNGIRNSKYKVMKHVYNDHKVTDQEAVHLTTYFESVKGESASVGVFSFIGYGVVLMVLIFVLIGFIYRDRLRD